MTQNDSNKQSKSIKKERQIKINKENQNQIQKEPFAWVWRNIKIQQNWSK